MASRRRIPAAELEPGDSLDPDGLTTVAHAHRLPTGEMSVCLAHHGLRVLSIRTYRRNQAVAVWRPDAYEEEPWRPDLYEEEP